MEHERLTSRQLRAKVAESGYQLSGKRFREARDLGVIPPPDADGFWSEEAVKPLVRFGELSQTVRSRPRRVVLLHCEGYAVPPDNLRDAMDALIPTITKPVQKMKRASRARQMLAGPDVVPLTVRERARRQREAWSPPPPPDWRAVIRDADATTIDSRFGIWCLAALWARERARETSGDISTIPLEELVTLFAIEDIAAEQARRERATANAIPAI